MDRFIYTFSLFLIMTTVRAWVVINVSLSCLSLILLLYLFGVHLPSLGQAVSVFDTTEPICLVEWKNEFTSWSNLDQCCLEARKQLSCNSEDVIIGEQEMSRVCETGKSTVRFHFNEKAYSYCRRQPIW